MGQTVRSGLSDRRERRELGSDWRAGRFSRDSAYALNVAFARRRWRALLIVASLPAVFIPWALWFTDGIGLTARAPWPLIPTLLVAGTGGGIVARRRSDVRLAAHAWMATNIGFLLLWIGLVIYNLV